MFPTSDRRFLELKVAISAAGDFGDGIDTSAYNLQQELGAVGYSADQRVGVWLALLAELASAVDNSDWETVRTSRLARMAQDTLAIGWIEEPLLLAAVKALDQNEDRFFELLSEVFVEYVASHGGQSGSGPTATPPSDA